MNSEIFKYTNVYRIPINLVSPLLYSQPHLKLELSTSLVKFYQPKCECFEASQNTGKIYIIDFGTVCIHFVLCQLPLILNSLQNF